MFSRSWFPAFAFAVVMLPVTVFAGGPPQLCLPIDGVTAGNASRCTDLLTAKLAEKIWLPSERGIRLRQHAQQWYVTFYMKEEVGLGEVESALAKSGFSIPRDKLHLYGHAILEIEGANRSTGDLQTTLKKLPHLSVEDSKRNGDTLLVTLDMPYPRRDIRSDTEPLEFDTFVRSDLSSDQSARSEPPATPQSLPGYGAVRDMVSKHNLRLKDIRWDTHHACRSLGCVAGPDSNKVASAAAK